MIVFVRARHKGAGWGMRDAEASALCLVILRSEATKDLVSLVRS
jgi:hypothetical protein